MGMDTYLLLKLDSSELDTKTKKELAYNPEKLGGAHAVKNIKKPGLLVSTHINWNDACSLEQTDLLQEIADCMGKALLLKNTSSRGLLLFADGGEPQTSWPRRATYEELVEELTSEGPNEFYRWIQYSHEDVEGLHDREQLPESLITRAEWRKAFLNWFTAVAELSSSKRPAARDKTWWEVSDYYFTSLELEEGLTEILERGFLTKDEYKLLKKFDSKFRTFVPEIHEEKVGLLINMEWREICLEAQKVFPSLLANW